MTATFCATLVDEWRRAGLVHAVLSPGSRSTPLALALARSDLALHVHLDERSAGFIGLGIGVATGRPAVVLTTSGTAAAELHPAVVEAHQGQVPLIVVTADRPPELQDVGAPQTIDQTHLYGRSVRWFAEPGVPDDDARATWRRLAARAVAEAEGSVPGPVHLNLAFREPLVGRAGGLDEGLPPGRAAVAVDRGRPAVAGPTLDALRDLAALERGVVVAGAGIAEPEAVGALADALGWPVLADPRSGARRPGPTTVAAADAILRHCPRLVISDPRWSCVSGPRPPRGWSTSARRHRGHAGPRPCPWVLDRPRPLHRPDRDRRRRLPRALLGRIHPRIGGRGPRPFLAPVLDAARASGPGCHRTGPGRPRRADRARPGPRPAGRPARRGHPRGLVVHAVRDLEWYGEPRRAVRVVANRGANGIDGVTSTAVGVALASETGGRSPTVLLVGDVAFLHDTNGLLGLARRPVDLTVVVVDNDGGGIFSFLPQRQSVPPETFELLLGTPHGVDLAALSAAHGLAVEQPATAADVVPAIRARVVGGGPGIVHVRTARDANLAVHDEIHAAVAEAIDALG
ncbi:MAG: 2-succinyl-5-enolpyruvyl-6-hydroxy-3-cyclohexene-1-carboxylic-acid synthase [Acidimicrobiales bacterium]